MRFTLCLTRRFNLSLKNSIYCYLILPTFANHIIKKMKALKKPFILLIISILIIEPSFSQVSKSKVDEIKYPNIIKINSLALAYSNASIIYERGIMPRLSAGIGFGYKYKGIAPKMFSVDNSTIQADIDAIKGYSITPEVRYYIKTCDPSILEGFYGGLYLRYTHYSSAVDFAYFPANKTPQNYQSDLFLNEYGVGIQLGYQLMVKERFSIDFLFFGPRFSSYHLGYEFNQTPSQEFLDDLSGRLNEVIDRFGLDYDVNIKKQGSSKANTSFSFANMRFGLSLGYAF